MRKIVLFEPDRNKRALHGLILQTQGYDIEWTGDERRARSLCDQVRPDLLLVGLYQPLSGIFDLYDRFRDRYPKCKIAFVPGELALCDLFFDGDRIRFTGATDFTADVERFLRT